MTPETLDKWLIVPRLMMILMSCVYVRSIEWALSQPDLTTQQASLISVITGDMTGSLALFLNKESKGGSNDNTTT